MKKIEELEKELEGKFEEFKAQYKPYDQTYKEIEPQLKKEKSSKKAYKKFTLLQIVVAIAACTLIFVTGGITAYFLLQKDNSPAYRYEDTDILAFECEESDLENIDGLLDLSLLSNKIFGVGKHKETHENVYFTVSGIFDDDFSLREIEMIIILKNEYHPSNEANYQGLENTFIVNEKTINYAPAESEFPFSSYYIGINISYIRYYINYKTLDENDVETFFTDFIK